jgi:hypothetical protein
MDSDSINKSRDHPLANQSQLPRLGLKRKAYLHENRKINQRSSALLKKWKSESQSGRCFILANGPSINEVDVSLLKNEVCFGVNATYQLFERLDWFPEYYLVTQRDRLLESISTFRELSHRTKFAYCDGLEYPTPHTFTTGFSEDNTVLLNQRLLLWGSLMGFWPVRNTVGYFFNRRVRKRAFSENPFKGVYLGKSVVFACLQIAYWLGFDEIFLLGVDMNYSGKSTHFFGNASWVPDQNYELEVAPIFHLFAQYLKRHRVMVYNCSMESRVQDFPKIKFGTIFGA